MAVSSRTSTWRDFAARREPRRAILIRRRAEHADGMPYVANGTSPKSHPRRTLPAHACGLRRQNTPGLTKRHATRSLNTHAPRSRVRLSRVGGQQADGVAPQHRHRRVLGDRQPHRRIVGASSDAPVASEDAFRSSFFRGPPTVPFTRHPPSHQPRPPSARAFARSASGGLGRCRSRRTTLGRAC